MSEEKAKVTGVIWITTDDIITVSPNRGAPTLTEMRGFVGGNIEVGYAVYQDRQVQMIINEDGLVLELPFNSFATGLFIKKCIQMGSPLVSPIVGNAILLDGCELE